VAGVGIIKLSSHPRAAYWGRFLVTTTWQTFNTQTMLNRVNRAIGGASLATWMQTMAIPYFQDEIVDRFAYEGDDRSGEWAPLKDSTNRIREALGYPPEHPINERTGEMLEWLASSGEFIMGLNSAIGTIPGDAPSDILAQKFRTAQMGTNENRMIPGAHTPPRPVLAVSPAEDMAILLKGLQVHIMQHIAAGL
jgi:hypothetical protein